MEKRIDAVMYVVKDVEAEMFDIPFFCKDDLFARRKFMIDVRTGGNAMISQFPEHFNLYRLGTYDSINGKLDQEFVLILKGVSLKEEKKNEVSNGT